MPVVTIVHIHPVLEMLMTIVQYLPCVCMRSRVMRLVLSVCVRTYVRIYTLYIYLFLYMSTKNRLFSALQLENLLLCVICCLLSEFKCLQCGLLHPANYRARAIHAFPNKTWRSPGPKIFSSEL